MATTSQAKRSGARSRRRKTPASQLRRKLQRGDWLVQQVKSDNNLAPKQHETLAEMGLLKIGRSGLFRGDRPESWGQVSRVQHLVAIRPLTQQRPKTSHRVPSWVFMSQPVRKPILYEVGGREAHHHKFDGDSFMSVEPYDDSVAVNWSTALPIATVLEKLDPKFVKGIHSCLVFDPSQGEHREIETAELLPGLRAGQCSYPFVRMESDGVVLVWQQPTYPNHVDEDIRAGRIGVIWADLDARMLTRMMQKTATPPVGACVAQLVADVEAVSSSGK
jgi:ribosomal protein L30/L7E